MAAKLLPLVHEAWLRLGGDIQPPWQNRGHFFAAAAEAMRRILIGQPRHRCAERHGGGQERVDASAIELVADVADGDQMIAIREALEKFAAAEPKKRT